MWKLILTLTLFLSLGSLAGCEVSKMSRLEDITVPYAGVYECEEMLFGGRDVTAEYPMTLELGYGGSFSLRYAGQETLAGKYRVDTVREEITLTSGEKSRTFRMEKGTIVIGDSFLGNSLVAKFSMG